MKSRISRKKEAEPVKERAKMNKTTCKRTSRVKPGTESENRREENIIYFSVSKDQIINTKAYFANKINLYYTYIY